MATQGNGKSARLWLERARTWAREHGVAAVVLGVAAVALTMPLATVRWLPFVDYPQHLGTIAAIHGQGEAIFDRFFVVEYARSQYLLLYVLGDWLAALFGVEGAGRATAVLSIATLPLAVGWYLRVHGRPAMLGALAAPVAMHAYVFWGFLNYAAGMVLAIVAVAAHARLVQRPDARRAAWLAIAALATFYAHAQLYAWMGLACIVQLVAMAPAVGRARAVRALIGSIVAALPSVIAMAWWLRQSGVIERGEAGSRSGHAAEVAAQGAAPIFTPVADTMRSWLGHSFDVYRDGSGVTLAVAFFAGVVLVIALRGWRDAAVVRAGLDVTTTTGPWWRRMVASAPECPMPRTIAPELVLLLTFALYLFAPFSYRLIEPINHRFLPLALALLPVLGPRGALPMRTSLVLAPALIALAVATGQVHAERFGETDREMGELSAALEHTEPGARLLGLIFDPQSEVVPLPIYLHAHQYFQARVGGLACFSFVEFPKSPVQYAEGAAPPPFPPRFEWTPQRYDHAVWGESFDYWLVRHESGRDAPRSLFRGAPDAPEPVFESDRWTLFARPR
ncbi:hypothetical protein [Sandaracinus amylolyticus]|uniref:hypothetical protein n=1 Tax=Sandaracinus amylolyticus TaxID=927083 RepID=UPI001F1591CD|nr:hypothetical protein [Sandaracinus amylolyticus]UJR79938.1 Hypothetical protein I5071_19780 [Sandaracinus amylolyticus]